MQLTPDAGLATKGAAAGRLPMPLTEYEPFFPDDEHALMSNAFELAWQKLAASLGATKSDEEIQVFRAKLAECVIISALEVEGPENVAEEALRCLHEDHLLNHGVPLT
jgi:hypothetical protein